MALSPPVASSMTMPLTGPPVPSATTEYCVLSARAVTSRGSTRIDAPGVIGRTWVVTSAPSVKRYQLSVTEVAPADWTTIGVDHPALPPSVRVTFGNHVRAAVVGVAA